jgi:hypothetical protein
MPMPVLMTLRAKAQICQATSGTAKAVPFQIEQSKKSKGASCASCGLGNLTVNCYRGMFPCFLGGFLSRLVSSISRA